MKAKKSLGLKNNYVFARAKKALGQNFLKSEIALKKIIEAGEINPVRDREGSQRPSVSNGVKPNLVLEIGPGRGALTKKLLEAGAKVIAVEKDKNLYEFLKIKFKEEISSGHLTLIHDDILNFNLSYKPLTKSYKLIANIPYNITGAILKKFLTEKKQPTLMVLMVQHEVAKRIIARDGKESILSVSVKAYGEPKMIMKVPARYFSPAPKIDSAIIKINNISRKLFKENNIDPVRGREGSQRSSASNGVDEEKFWEIVKTGFAHKRKKLSGNLKKIIPTQKLFLGGWEDKRAEDLSLLDWIALAKN